MIDVLQIKNFKSILDLKLDCRRVNVFIGEPNTGKSNILESLGLLSFGHYGSVNDPASRFLRYERTANLFYDEILENPVQISSDLASVAIEFNNGSFEGEYRNGDVQLARISGDHEHLARSGAQSDVLATFKSYKFRVLRTFDRRETGYLLPPSGENLVSLLVPRRRLRSLVNDVFSPFGLRLGVRPQERKIELIKDFEDIVISYPFSLASDTLQRVVFYLSAIHSNQDSVLVFEEPEAHAFPYYTRHLAEMIGLDEANNQYFISTHNPYFLEPLLAKTRKDEIAIFITYYEDYQTKVKLMSEGDLQRVTEVDVFSNLDSFLEES